MARDGLLAGRQALVVGAGGIGSAITTALHDQGCRVLATGIDAQEVERLEARLALPGIQLAAMDVTCDRSVQSLVEQLPALDILVNCAGIILRDQREFELDDFSRVLAVNLTGTMRMCMACQPALAAGDGGCVVNIASMLSYFGSATAPAYSSSKGAIVQLTRSLAIAWAPQGIRVNAIAPGWIVSPLTAPLVADERRSRQLVERTPLGRWGQPEDVGGAAVFLCSPWARFITGAVLPVDGGYSIA